MILYQFALWDCHFAKKKKKFVAPEIAKSRARKNRKLTELTKIPLSRQKCFLFLCLCLIQGMERRAFMSFETSDVEII